MSDDDFTVTLADYRAARLCSSGARAWGKYYGLSWDDFIDKGIPASKLIPLNDAFANRVLEQARKRLNR